MQRSFATGRAVVPYKLTRTDLASITDVECAFGTTKLLPPEEVIPEEFWSGNAYTQLAECLFHGRPLQEGTVTFRPGFEDVEAPQMLNRVVRAHLISFAPSHQSKIAGVGFMISLVCALG